MTPALQTSTPFVLLRANREALQRESQKWMETLDFLDHEIKFFVKMLKMRRGSSRNESLQISMQSVLENQLSVRLENLIDDLVAYRKKIGEPVKNGNGSLNWNYEEEHRRLSDRVEKFKVDMQLFKKSAFGFIADLYLNKATIKFV
jgi:hypothetical protein